MPASKLPLPPPTPEQTQTALDHASKLHYAFAVRPPVDSASRKKWERRFKRDLFALVNQLAAARFSELPALAIGCVWELNRSHAEGAAPFDMESIRPAIGDHPALKGPGQLRYRDGGDGPNALIAEKELRSVWWDEFREEAARAAATGTHGSHVSADGESEVGEEGTGTQVSEPAQSEPSEVPPSSRQLRPRKTPGAEAGKAPQGQSSRPKHAAEAGKASQGQSSRHALSQKAADKRTASAATARGRAAAPITRGTLTLADIPPEVIPNAFIEHPQPCRRCAKSGYSCLINPFFKSTCQKCSKGKAKCSLAFDIKSDHVLAAYLGFAYCKILSNPDVFAAPDFSPTNHPNPLPSKESIQWFVDQFAAARLEEGAEPLKTDAEPEPQPEVPQPAAQPQTARSGKGRATADAPKVPSGPQASGSGAGGPAYTKRALRSRPGSPVSSTLPGTPVSAASPPPRSPSAHSATSSRAPAVSEHDSDGNTVAAPPADSGKKKGKGKAKARKILNLTQPSSKIPVRRMSKRGNTVMNKEDASVDKDAVTIRDSVQAHGSLFDGDIDDTLATTEYLETKSDTEVLDYELEDAVPDTDIATALLALGDQSGPNVKPSETGTSLGGLSGTRNTKSERLPPVPGTHSLEVLKSIHGVPHNVRPTPMSPPELSLPTTLKVLPAPPSRPQSPILPLRRDLFVAPINGSWRGLRRIGPRNADGTYSILPPRDQTAPAVVTRPPRASLLTFPNPLSTSPEAPKTPSEFVFGIPAYEVAHQTRATYDKVAAMALTVEKHSQLLAQQSITFLQRHETLYRKVEHARTWQEGALPVLAHAKGIVKDVKSLVDMLANLHSVVAGIASAFDVVPPVPANWIALMEILETGRRLQDLHRFTWAKLDQFEEDLRPLRREAATLRVDCDDVRHRLDSILSEVDDLVAPLLRNMARNFSEGLARLETRVAQVDGATMDSGAPDVAGPRRANMGDLVRSISSVADGLRQLEARVRDIDGGTKTSPEDASQPASPSPTIHDISTMLGALTARLDSLDGSAADVRPSTSAVQGPHPPSIGDIMVSVTRLTERIAELETRTAPTPTTQDIDAQVASYLSRLGLSEDMLRRVATHFFYTAAPGAPAGSISTAPTRPTYPSTPRITGAFQGAWAGSERRAASHRDARRGTMHSIDGGVSPLTSYSTEDDPLDLEVPGGGAERQEDGSDEEDGNSSGKDSSTQGEE